MGLRFKILSGPLQGREFSVAAGAVIGRAAVDIQINDPKISGRHAKIELDSTGALVLVDLGSKSGIRANNKRVDRLKLESGLNFTVGRTHILVLGELADATPAPSPVEIEWFEYLSEFSLHALEKVEDSPLPLLPFHALLVLSVVAGVQAGTVWELGYGPRDLGLGSLDLPIFEENTPLVAFTVSPSGSTALFSTRHPQKIRLNGRSVSSETLVAGDEIQIGETKIKVSYRSDL